MHIKRSDTNSTASSSNMSDDYNDDHDIESQASSYIEVTVADEDEHDMEHHAPSDKVLPLGGTKKNQKQLQRPTNIQKPSMTSVSGFQGNHLNQKHSQENNNNKSSSSNNMIRSKSPNLSPKRSTNRTPPRSRCNSNDSEGFELVLRPNLDRDVSALTEFPVPMSPAVHNDATPRWGKKPVRKDSGFDLVVSNHSIPMSTLTMMDFASQDGNSTAGGSSGGNNNNNSNNINTKSQTEFGADFQQKWLATTPRNVDQTILEDASEKSFDNDSYGGNSSNNGSSSNGRGSKSGSTPPVSLTKLKESRDTKKQHALKSTNKENEPKKDAAPVKDTKDKTKIKAAKPRLSGTRKSSAGRTAKGVAKPDIVSKHDSAHSADSSKAKKTKAKKNKSIVGKMSVKRESESHQPTTPKKNKATVKEIKTPDSSTSSKKSSKRKSKNKSSTGNESPTKSPSSGRSLSKSPNKPKRVSTPKKSDSTSSPKSRRSTTGKRSPKPNPWHPISRTSFENPLPQPITSVEIPVARPRVPMVVVIWASGMIHRVP